MLFNRTTFALCAGLIAASGCAHEQKKTETSAREADVIAVAPKAPAAHAAERAPDPEERKAGESNGSTAQAEACELAVYFDSNSSRLDASSEQRLDTVAECMKNRVVDHATIVGQTDPSGSEQRNKELGLERAQAVAAYLRGRGVPDQQIRVRSKGEMASAQPEELWPVERRAGVDVK